MININHVLQPADLTGKLKRFWELSGEKINLLEKIMTMQKDRLYLQ